MIVTRRVNEMISRIFSFFLKFRASRRSRKSKQKLISVSFRLSFTIITKKYKMAVNATEINEIIILNDGTEENQTTFETRVESEENVAILITAFLAPIGLGLFRSGLCQRKTFVHSLVKPFVHLAFGTIGFWILGSGFASDSSNSLIGMDNFFLNKDSGPREIFQVLQL